jgi:hypothetical protein
MCVMKIFKSGKYLVPEGKFQVQLKPGVSTSFSPCPQLILHNYQKLVARGLLIQYVKPRDVTTYNMVD